MQVQERGPVGTLVRRTAAASSAGGQGAVHTVLSVPLLRTVCCSALGASASKLRTAPEATQAAGGAERPSASCGLAQT